LAGIYIHIPFCKQACTYCNFYFSTSLRQKESFINALLKEITTDRDFIDRKEIIDTIYFGGGTPSILSEEELHRIFEVIHNNFSVSEDAEITLEANPDDIEKNKLKGWMSSGINRLSLGVQSFNEAELRWMNRAHSAEESLGSIDMILEAGINNFSVDLIFGSPLLSDESLIKNLEIISERRIPHLSCYGLTVEPKTALYKMIELKKSLPVDNEHQANQFLLVMKYLESAGYEQYEISNYAREGFRSKHNSSYWQGKSYYGFGPSAHSYNGKNSRRWNVANIASYIKAIDFGDVFYQEEILTSKQQMNEYIMIALRTIEGIDLRLFSEKFGEDKREVLIAHANTFLQKEQLQQKNERLTLTTRGKLLADHIAAELFF
jgi:oxygen-independent coproporphyrinogen-3 oxidase